MPAFVSLSLSEESTPFTFPVITDVSIVALFVLLGALAIRYR